MLVERLNDDVFDVGVDGVVFRAGEGAVDGEAGVCGVVEDDADTGARRWVRSGRTLG